MKKIVILIAFGFLLISACKEEETCSDTIIPQYTIELSVKIYVFDKNDEMVIGYPSRYIVQKTFCDGDVGFPIEESGNTTSYGYFWGKYWNLPYTNEKDYVTCYLYAGTLEGELGYSIKIDYNDIKGTTIKQVEHNFYLPN